MGAGPGPLINYNRRVKRIIASLILVVIFFIVVLGSMPFIPKKGVFQESGRIKVVVSFYPLSFLAQEIGKELVEVTNITPAGVEPHDYELTARDIMAVQQAKLIILNGGQFEAWGEKVKEDLRGSGVFVLEASEGLVIESDPHVWLSPELLKKEVALIEERLGLLDPTNSSYYYENGKELNRKLEKLQMEYRQGLANCKTRDFVTSHKAFDYLAREFGLNQISIAGLTPEEEPSTKQLVEVTKLAKEKDIKYIFFEKLVSPKLSETIANEVGARTLILDPVEGISDNDLIRGKNYLTVMQENLINLRLALECQ